jgi:hypothetical protein
MIQAGFIAALLGSRWFLYAVGMLAFAGAYEGWKYHQQHIGRDKVVAVIEGKAKDDADLANSARADVDAGKRGLRGKYQRPE